MLSSPVPEPADFYAREYVTFGQVHERALRLAGWLREHGVVQGSRVSVGGANSTGWVVAFTAVHLLGAVPVFLNSTLVIDAQVHCLTKTKPQFSLIDAQLAQVLAPRADELKAKGVGPLLCWSSVAHLDPVTRKHVADMSDPRPSARSVRDVVDGTCIHNLGPESDGIIFFTSGTTSMPKAVLSTQRSALHSVLSAQISSVREFLRHGKNFSDLPEQGPVPTLLAIPMFHVTGCLSWLLRFFRTGSKAVFMRKWNVGDAIKLIQDENIKIVGG
jgi:acyl-CoA synthetase (AMP-forming)/AMP-acid ligase II